MSARHPEGGFKERKTAEIEHTYNMVFEMRTTAGPSRQVQCVLSGGPYTRLVAGSAGLGGVSAAVPEAGLMTDEDLAGAEGVPVRASGRRVGDPLPSRGLYQLA